VGSNPTATALELPTQMLVEADEGQSAAVFPLIWGVETVAG